MENLITNRTLEDVQRWQQLQDKGFDAMTAEEQAEWLSVMRGTYGIVDLNRVGEAMAFLAGEFNRYGYAVAVSSRTDWTMGETPTESAMALYLRDLGALRETFAVMQNTPMVPESMEGLTWQRANDIEQILTDLNRLILQMVRAFLRSGDVFAWSGAALHIPTADIDRGRTWNELDKMKAKWKGLDTANWYLLGYGNLEANA